MIVFTALKQFFFANRPFALVVTLGFLASCAEVTPIREKPVEDHPDAHYEGSDLDALLDFGARLAGEMPSKRAETCRELLNRKKEVNGRHYIGLELHLMIGRLLSDACGDLKTILEDVESIPLNGLPDERVRQLVSEQTEVLKRILELSRKQGTVERRRKTPQSSQGTASRYSTRLKQRTSISKNAKTVRSPGASDNRAEDAPGSTKNPSKVLDATTSNGGNANHLRDKLEAIRAMERKLDETSGGN